MSLSVPSIKGLMSGTLLLIAHRLLESLSSSWSWRRDDTAYDEQSRDVYIEKFAGCRRRKSDVG